MKMLIRSLEVHVHFNARTRVDTVPERSPALHRVGTPKYWKRLTMPYTLKLNRILLYRSHIAVIRAIYSLFKQCTYIFEAFNYTFKYTIHTYAHLRGFAFTVWMGLCHNNLCSKHHYLYHRIAKQKRNKHNSLLFCFSSCFHCPHLRCWTNHDGLTTNKVSRTSEKVSTTKQRRTEDGKGKEKY